MNCGLTQIVGWQNVERKGRLCQEIHGGFDKMIDAQCDQPLNVALAFNAIKGHVVSKVKALIEEFDDVIECEKRAACGGLQKHLDASKKQCVCLHCNYHVLTSHAHSAVLCTDLARTVKSFKLSAYELGEESSGGQKRKGEGGGGSPAKKRGTAGTAGTTSTASAGSAAKDGSGDCD
jgi:hypothetical protein